ncbi:uncharacterized protein LOC120345990 isoform X2 [Styela clava]
MRQQRTGRQKFQDLRRLTFQDWIIPHYNNNNNNNQNSIKMMKNHSLPVFSYTKMETCPPLSTINSQFAWAGHVLPDLVQEQSDRLLRRLERPKTAGNRLLNLGNNRMKGRKLSRPSSAVSYANSVNNSSETTSIYRMDYTMGNSPIANAEVPHVTQNIDTVRRISQENLENDKSPESERSSSPDFIANLYKEYEKKLSTDLGNEVISPHDNRSPRTKLLRRPSVQFKVEQKKTQTEKSSEVYSHKGKERIHCVVKLPCEENTSSNFQKNDLNKSKRNFDLRSKSEPPKSDTWLDLSELCHPSDGDDGTDSDHGEIELRRPSVASESFSSLKLLDLINECDGAQERDNALPSKCKISRPSTTKHSKKSRPKSRHKKRKTSSQAEESTKEYSKGNKKFDVTSRQARASDKLREEIETQMSKLDFDGNTARSNQKNEELLIASTPNSQKTFSNDVIPKIKSSSWTVTSQYSNYTLHSKSSIPLKKIPIQILSDPFTTNVKIYHGKQTACYNGKPNP